MFIRVSIFLGVKLEYLRVQTSTVDYVSRMGIGSRGTGGQFDAVTIALQCRRAGFCEGLGIPDEWKRSMERDNTQVPFCIK